MSFPVPTTFALEEIFNLARQKCPFYAHLYAALPDQPELSALPVIDQAAFWQAHQQDRQAVLTGALDNGIVVNSGGTSGTPKYSYFSDEDWDSITALSAHAYEMAGLRDGDRVGNFFASGNLYASFIFATGSLKTMRPRVMQFPLGFAPNFEAAATVIRDFKINALAGVPAHLLRIIDHLDKETMPEVHVDRIVYGGELFSRDRQDYLEERFPGIQIRSAGYASVDAGLMGYADETCAMGEHRIFDGAMILEIIDEKTGESIDAVSRPGRVVFTNLTRRLMPLIRYPSGDRAQWVEPPGSADRKFQLLGRSEEAARVSHYSVEVAVVAAMLEPFRVKYGIEQFQLLVNREQLHDVLTFRLVADASLTAPAEATAEILEAFQVSREDIRKSVQAGTMHPPRLEWIRRDQLVTSERTGKLLRVVDRRDG